MNAEKRRVEVFSAGCPACHDAIELVERLRCDTCELVVLDMHDPDVAQGARDLGVRSVPVVAIDGALAGCCSGRGPDERALREAGIGRSGP